MVNPADLSLTSPNKETGVIEPSGKNYDDNFWHAFFMSNHMNQTPGHFIRGIRGRTLWHNEYRSNLMYQAVTQDGNRTLGTKFQGSLRMGPLGYQSEAQASLAVSFNSLKSYAASLHPALTRPYPPYEAIGLRHGDEYRQLATSLLQIENEFYGTIRPKRRIHPGERPLHALGERGVEYVEVRLLDLDPFLPIGIGAATMRLLDVFLLHCLLSDSSGICRFTWSPKMM